VSTKGVGITQSELSPGYGMGDREIVVLFLAEARGFSKISRPAVVPAQRSMQWVPGVKAALN
jgi:hypothetical protein